MFVDTTFFLLVAVPVHARPNCALNVFYGNAKTYVEGADG